MKNTRQAIQMALENNPRHRNIIIMSNLMDGAFDNRISPAVVDKLMAAVDLTIKETQVVALRFDPSRVRTYEEIGKELGITKARVHQIMANVAEKISQRVKESRHECIGKGKEGSLGEGGIYQG